MINMEEHTIVDILFTSIEHFYTQETHINTDLLISEVQAFEISEGKIGTLGIRYPQDGYIRFAPAADCAIDATKRNTANISVCLLNQNGIILFSRDFDSVVQDGSLYVFIRHEKDLIEDLPTGSYYLKVFIKSLHIYLSDTQSAISNRIILYQSDETEYTSEEIHVSFNHLQDEIFEITDPNGGEVSMAFDGYTDFVCDPNHSSVADKICKLKDGESQDIKISYLIRDIVSEDILYSTSFYAEKINEYTLRIRSKNPNTIYAIDTPEDYCELWTEKIHLPQGSYRLESIIENMDIIQECLIPIKDRYIQHTHQKNESSIQEALVDGVYETNVSVQLRTKKITPYNLLWVVNTDALRLVNANDEVIEPTLTFEVGLNEGETISTINTHIVNDKMTFRIRDWETENVVYEIEGGAYVKSQNGTSVVIAGVFNADEHIINLSPGKYIAGFECDVSFEYNRYPTHPNAGYSINSEQTTFSTYHFSDQFSFQEQVPIKTYESEVERLSDTNPISLQLRSENTITYQPPPSFELTNDTQGTISCAVITRNIPVVTYGESTDKSCYVGVYVYGSYDGRKWALLGGKEKSGTFTDIGCKIEHTDVRFLRFCIAGNVKGNSRINHIEVSSESSMLKGKIR